MTTENELLKTYCGDTVIATEDEELLSVDILDIESKKFDRFKKGVAYLHNGYYYTFKGNLPADETNIEPGVYLKEGEYKLVEVSTDEQKRKYNIDAHIVKLDVDSLVADLKNNKDIVIKVPESSKAFIPPITKDDDILKRAIKKALMEKNIDIDQYRPRFTDKNALFNFKQVIKGPAKLSMLLFERGAEALNLQYTLIVREKDDENYIGNKLEDDIVVSSEDTYEI